MRVLAIDDNRDLLELVQTILEEEGYVVDTAPTGEKGEALASCAPYDLIILDIGLPGKNGFEVCKSLRAKGMRTPILMLTGKTASEDQVEGLESGADYYLVKPFCPSVLCATVKALLKREPQLVAERLRFGKLVLDLGMRQVWNGNEEICLTGKEYSILEYLIRHRNLIATRLDLEQHCWGVSFDESSNIVDQHIKNLRKKLGDDLRIETVRRSGYRVRG